MRLKRTHYADGDEKKAGRIIELYRFHAEWLAKHGAAEIIA